MCWLGGERFQINVGTCGSHDLLPEERGYTMADFYIGIGKLHANTELFETIKDALSTMQNASQIFRKRCVS